MACRMVAQPWERATNTQLHVERAIVHDTRLAH
jgi:hypothetical protein